MQRGPDRVLDEYLVLAAQAGNRTALNELVRRWMPRLLRHAQHLLGSADQAKDAVQETWAHVIRGLPRLDDPARFPAWAYTIATRRCADAVRGNVRFRAFRDASQSDPTNSDAHCSSDEALDMRGALSRLPPEQGAVTAMFYGSDLSVEEIATALSIPVGTVKSRLHHARETLKKILGKE